jgi:hypothetical protein
VERGAARSHCIGEIGRLPSRPESSLWDKSSHFQFFPARSSRPVPVPADLYTHHRQERRGQCSGQRRREGSSAADSGSGGGDGLLCVRRRRAGLALGGVSSLARPGRRLRIRATGCHGRHGGCASAATTVRVRSGVASSQACRSRGAGGDASTSQPADDRCARQQGRPYADSIVSKST